MKYADRVYGLSEMIRQVGDTRKGEGEYQTPAVARGLLVMLLARVGSFNALEQHQWGGFAKRWVGGRLPKADQMGRITASVETKDLRVVSRKLIRKMKRNKALRKAFEEGRGQVVVDGHEISASFLRCCPDCLERTIHMSEEDRVQYYHRCVTAMWVCGEWTILLDMEMQAGAEDEVACSVRCLERVIRDYGRSFDKVVADSLYARAPFFKMCLDYGKDAMAVLKDERREVLRDAEGLMDKMTPEQWEEDGKVYRCWDLEGFESWDAMDRPVRVVRTVETQTIRRQKDGRLEVKTAGWWWVMTLSKEKFPSRAAVKGGHRRWAVENEGFNELVNEWHADHVYKHDVNAMTVIWLLLFVAYNLFHAFIRLNVKAAMRIDKSIRYWVDRIKANFYAGSDIIPDTS
ncbi:MAG: hypothetical protein A3I06_08545 [Candidatus Lindowbacteria bacterium RIFCSPLOWO2_02_FULL_62_12]|nr:MAG: hypothetical protein A3I06_08545 [Candidatus Lindowbacteria bacterium RIFCSPLOWO2_02_FULL_62_12]